MLDLHRLELLRRYAAVGSIAAVAAETGYSAAAVSQHLATLEREAGLPLLERRARSSRLTDAGRELADHAAAILAAVEQAEARMRQRAGEVGGLVRVHCLPALAPGLAPWLAAVQRQHPQLRVVARESGSLLASGAVSEARCDLAIVDAWDDESPTSAPGIARTALVEEELVVGVPPGHDLDTQSRRRLTERALASAVEGATWLCAPEGELSRAAGDRLLARLGAEPRTRWEFQGLSVLAALVASGAGVSLLPAGTAREHPSIGVRRLPWPMTRRVDALTRASSRPDPAVQACLEAVRDALAGQGASREVAQSSPSRV